MNTYVDDDGRAISKHIQEEYFRGNTLFASLRQLQFYCTGPKDDMISIFYLILYLLGHKELVQMSKHKLAGDDAETFMDMIIQMKRKTSPEKMVKDIKALHSNVFPVSNEVADLQEKL